VVDARKLITYEFIQPTTCTAEYAALWKKANKNYVSLILYNTATLRMAGALEKSSEVMKYMQQLVKVPEIQATMQELSKEMMKVCTLLSMYMCTCTCT